MSGKLDYGISDGKGLSYSRRLTLHACPRKFQLENIYNLGMRQNTIDFAYGHAVAAGIQSLVVEPDNINLATVCTAAAWTMPISEVDFHSKKSLWYAIRMVQKFYELLRTPATNFLRNYEIAMFPTAEGTLRPAVELTFCINCYGGYVYEGHIDLVLKEKDAAKYLVLEAKTTKFVEVSDSSYKNSDQGLGYSLVVDSIARDLEATGSYSVLYLIGKSTRQEFEYRIYPKSRVQRAQFINGLILDIEIESMYRELNIYPMYGESCFNFFKPCEFFGRCDSPDAVLLAVAKTHGAEGASFKQMKYFDFVYELEEIKRHQEELLEVI